ncbi:MAG TPA: tetratricopeptide repeat protein, partial [Verrucomicrobiae bacterium]|nr:tetratricopeptide repeat protein [Verrucomicrobiae bacterium]
LLDIAPTILTVAGLPIGENMSGRPLLEAFVDVPPFTKIPTWENVPGPEWRVPDIADASESKLLEQFVALGYVQPQAGSQEFYAKTVQAETDWTLTCSLIYSGQFSAALPLLENIYEQFPLRFDFGCMLGECYLRLRLIPEAREIITALAESFPGRPMAQILMGALESESGNAKQSLDYFLQAEKLGGASSDLFVRLGRLYLRLGQVDKSLAAFDKSLALDSDNALAHAGRARSLLRLQRCEDAAEAALDAVGLEFSLADAHLTLGLALVRLGQLDKAVGAMETSLRFNPLRLAAHRFLISLYEKIGGHDDQVRAHQKQIRDCMEAMSRRRKHVGQLREETRERARQRDEAHATMTAAPKPRAPHPVIKTDPQQEFFIVSGLPRSGTSLMMQMLHRGGLPVMRDEKRTPDVDNPEGYFEWEEIKQLSANRTLIQQTAGRAVKIVSPLLVHLPRNVRYRVIFTDRPVEEIASSQRKMRERLSGKAMTAAESAEMERLLRDHRAQTLAGLRAATQVSLLLLDYRELISAPEQTAHRVADFVGHERLPHWKEMAAAIKPELYRNRSKPEKPSPPSA